MTTSASLQSHEPACSPNSSEEIESRPGTPETKLTTFSPDDVRGLPKITPGGLLRANIPPAFSLKHESTAVSPEKGTVHASVQHSSQDPFLATSSLSLAKPRVGESSKLSPTASAFTPFVMRELKPPAGMTDTGLSPASTSISQDGSSSSGNLTSLSIYGPSTGSSGVQSLMPFTPGSDGPLSSARLPIHPEGYTGPGGVSDQQGHFSSDVPCSRIMTIGRLPRHTSHTELEKVLNNFNSIKHVVLDDLPAKGIVYITFTDIREAFKASSHIANVRDGWDVSILSTARLATKELPQGLLKSGASLYDGQIIVKADFSGPYQRFDAPSIRHLVRELLENYGEIMAYEADIVCPPVVMFRVEYYDSVAANNAVVHLNGFKVGGCTLDIVHYRPDFDPTPQRPIQRTGPLIVGQEDLGLEPDLRNLSLDVGFGSQRVSAENGGISSRHFLTPTNKPLASRRGVTPQPLSSPMQPSSFQTLQGSPATQSPWSPLISPYSESSLQSPTWARYNIGTIGQERGMPLSPQYFLENGARNLRGSVKLPSRQFHEFPAAHHNIVDIERIRKGSDVRTTIMLRNIPNKIDQAMLKDIVDETSFGKYDFMYLRIDFANNCNVGYAFINFEDPYFIIDFMNARAGHRWNRFNSDKVAEISYATIQGRDCLIQKFRNSSVMLEHPSFRPKIFHTGAGPLAGTEDKFPGPDNPSKMRRSVENAEHVGLFAPRAGQNFRDEQRRRRSQYDRGTRLAEMEDAYGSEHQEVRNQITRSYSGGFHETPRGFHRPDQGYVGA